MDEHDLLAPDGRALHAYDTGGAGLPVFWHHGTPNTGEPPEPLSAEGVRWLSHDRPGYGGSAPHPGRDVAAAAADVEAIADALGVERFAVVGHSGGGPHALACAALLPGRVTGVVCVASQAPPPPDGIALPGESGDPFTPADHAALDGRWAWLMRVVNRALRGDPAGRADDEAAYERPWGFDPAAVACPVLIVHGDDDLLVPAEHGAWLAARIPAAELWARPGDGHITVLDAAPAALDWLRGAATLRA